MFSHQQDQYVLWLEDRAALGRFSCVRPQLTLSFLWLRQEQEDLELKHNSMLKQLMREFNTQLAQKEQELEMTVKETISKSNFKFSKERIRECFLQLFIYFKVWQRESCLLPSAWLGLAQAHTGNAVPQVPEALPLPPGLYHSRRMGLGTRARTGTQAPAVGCSYLHQHL